eukprot:scaffold5772_cov145-Skeletonema_menzelii.AAC.8
MEVISIDDSDDEGSISKKNNSNFSFPEGAAATNINGDNDHEYRVILLMDHREFGCRNQDTNFLKKTELRVNNYFTDKHGIIGKSCEILSLKAADYMFVARKILKSTGQVVEERLFELIIERKDVGDLASCIIGASKDFKPLKFFEAQMHKFVNCGIERKIFLVEGDEDNFHWRTEGGGPASQDEKRKRRLRIKTTRLLVEHGRYKGVELVCTRRSDVTIQFLIHQMELLLKSFDPKEFAGMKTMQQFADHIKEKMNDPTFQKYLELRNQPGIGDKKAMKVIRDPNLNWDKSFVSPAEKHDDIKSKEEDVATYWTRSSARRQEDYAGAQPPPPPPPDAGSGPGNDQSGGATSNGRRPTVNRSASTASSRSGSSAASLSGASNGGATASSARSSNGSASARANSKTTVEESQGKKRDTTKKTTYKKRQKVSEKLYIQRKPSNLKPSQSTPKESSICENGYIPANPLHEARNSSLVAALLDDRKPAAKTSDKKGESVRNRQPCAVQSATKPTNTDFTYMLEFSEDDIEGQVVAVPTPRSKQNTKSDAEDISPAGDDARPKSDASSTTNPRGRSIWHDDYKDVLESSDDDSVASVEKPEEPAVCQGKSNQVGAKKANDNDVIDLIEDDCSVGSVIELLD